MAGYSLFDSPYWGVPNRLQWNPSAPPGSQNLIGDPRRRRKLTPAQVLPSARATQEVLSAPNPQFMGGTLPQAVMTPQQRQHAMRSRTFNRAPAPAQPFVDVGQGDYYGRDADDESLGMKDWSGHAAQEQRRVKDGTTAPRPEEIASWVQRERLRLQKELDPEVRDFQDAEYGKTFGKQGGLLEQVDEWIRTPTKTGESDYADTMISDEGDRIEESQAEVVLGRGGTKSLGEVMFPNPDDQMEVRREVNPQYTQDPNSGDASIAEDMYNRNSRKRASEAATKHIAEGGSALAAMQNYSRDVNDIEGNIVEGGNAKKSPVEDFADIDSGPTGQTINENKKAATGKVATDVAKAIAKSDPDIKPTEAIQTVTSSAQQNAERIWGNFSRESGSKRTKYLSAMNDMYKKMMILNVIAALTGSESQAPLFMEMAMAKMQALDKFDGMDRLDSIRKGVFYSEDGKFDPPKSRLMAFRRAIRFGANEKEAASLSGHHPTPSKTPATFSTWNRMGADGNFEQTTVQTGTRPPSDGGRPWVKGVGSQSAGTQTDRDRELVQGLVAAGDYTKAGAIIERDFVDDYLRWSYGAKPSAKDIQQHVESRLELLKRLAPSRPAQSVQTTAQQTMPGGGVGQPRTRAEARAILKQNNPGKSNTEIEERLDSMGYPR
jgi:hypothetical protein